MPTGATGIWNRSFNDVEAMLREEKDNEVLTMIREEKDALQEEMLALEEELKRLLLPKDPMDDKNTIIEVRSGTGGEEAMPVRG